MKNPFENGKQNLLILVKGVAGNKELKIDRFKWLQWAPIKKALWIHENAREVTLGKRLLDVGERVVL